MKRTALLALALGSLLALPAAVPAGEGGLAERIDRLVARWRDGDDPARAGVVAETGALGDDAVSELFRRVARPRPAAAPRLGIVVPAPNPQPAQERARVVMLTIRFARVAGPEGTEITKARILDPESAEALRAKLEFMAAPRLTVYEGQRAHVTIVEEKPYTRTYDGENVPVKGRVQTGMLLDVHPTVENDRIKLQLRCELAKLAGMDTVRTPAGAIEVPRVEKRESAITLTLEKGRAALALPGVEPLVVEIEGRVLGADFLEEVK